MIRRLRLMVLVARPPVVVLLGLYAATGLAQSGRGSEPVLLARVLAVVVAFLAFSVACNDLADEAIDRVNLAHDGRRPLVAGTANRRELVTIAVTSALLAVGVSTTLRWPAILVAVVGLALSAAYSLRPVRLADRGAVASVMLPACYVGVPYLLGIFASRLTVRWNDLVLLAGLYVGFIGRILLKDFRDVRGDALFGKRTFLVRHGRRWTCVFSACSWVVGSAIMLIAVRPPTVVLVIASAVCIALALGLLRALAVERNHRREEALVAAIAIVGRGMIVALLAHLSMTRVGWPAWAAGAVLVVLTAVTAGQAVLMARQGPRARLTIPAAMAAARAVKRV
jgi:4-hydroxybenzoate polyprenyltransferase